MRANRTIASLTVALVLVVGACGTSTESEPEVDMVEDGRLTLEKRLATRLESASGDVLQLIFLSTAADGLSVGVNQNGDSHPGTAGTRVERAPFVVEVLSVADDGLAMDVSVEHAEGEALTVVFREEPGGQFLPAWGPTTLVSLDGSATVDIRPDGYDGETFTVTAEGDNQKTFPGLSVGDSIEFEGFTIEFTNVGDDGLSIYATDPAGEPVR